VKRLISSAIHEAASRGLPVLSIAISSSPLMTLCPSSFARNSHG
jgi:hypothetical protein